MAQAILDLHANVDDAAALEDGKLPTLWSGFDIDNIHISTETYNRTEEEMQRALIGESCPIQTRLWLSHWEEASLYICTCRYFSSYGDITIKHGRTRHYDKKPAVMQVDSTHWHITCRFIAGLPEVSPALPAWPMDPSRDCMPRRRQESLTNYRIPKISVAAVRTKESNRSVRNPAHGAEIPKASRPPFMTGLEAKYRRKELQRRLAKVGKDPGQH